MFATNILVLLSPLVVVPWTKELEAACKEASKKIEAQAKTTVQKKLTKMFIEKIVCAEAGKLDKRLTKVGTLVMKKKLDANKKKIEADIKKKDPGSSKALELTGLRDDMLKAQKERDALKTGKPIMLPKPLGGGLHVPIKIRVFTKDNVEMDIEFFMGINYKPILKGNPNPKDFVTYGGANLIFRFGKP